VDSCHVNDAGTDAASLWTAQKIIKELSSTDWDDGAYNSTGPTINVNMKINADTVDACHVDDTSTGSVSNLWTSAKIVNQMAPISSPNFIGTISINPTTDNITKAILFDDGTTFGSSVSKETGDVGAINVKGASTSFKIRTSNTYGGTLTDSVLFNSDKSVTFNGNISAGGISTFPSYGSFTVGGDTSHWYPVRFTSGYRGMNGRNLHIYRQNVHENATWRGTINLTIRNYVAASRGEYNSTITGFGSYAPNFESVNIQTWNSAGVNKPLWNGIGTNWHGADLVVWLLGGGTTYYWDGDPGIIICDSGNSAGGTISDGENVFGVCGTYRLASTSNGSLTQYLFVEPNTKYHSGLPVQNMNVRNDYGNELYATEVFHGYIDGNTTGTLEIVLPVAGWCDAFFGMAVDFFSYGSASFSTFNLGGYVYSAGYWVSEVTIISKTNLTAGKIPSIGTSYRANPVSCRVHVPAQIKSAERCRPI
jgi:hypothetical protein